MIPAILSILCASIYLLSGNYVTIVVFFALQRAFVIGMTGQNSSYLSERCATEVLEIASGFCHHQGAVFGGLVRSIRAYYEETGYLIGFKPAGGISTAKGALDWLVLMKEELGRDWLEPDLFRIGASSLLGDIERQIEHFVTGRYAALNRHAMA